MKLVEAETETTVANANPGKPPVNPVHFVIEITVETDLNGKQTTVPRNVPQFMHPGDTAIYESPDGQVTVVFSPNNGHTSPYADATGDLQTVHDGVILNVVNEGIYFGKCSVTKTMPTGEAKTIGWLEDTGSGSSGSGSSGSASPDSGANHVVKP